MNKEEAISKTISLSDNIKGIYKHIFMNDVELFLFEVSQQAHSSLSERSGITKAVGEEIVVLAMELFPNVKVTDSLIR